MSDTAAGRWRGLFLNTKKAQCSIHESGMMAYQCLTLSSRFSLDYQEVDLAHRQIPHHYDFYVFNYHDSTSMAWLDTRSVQKLPGLKIAIVLEVAPNHPFVRVSPHDFDAYAVLDPTVARVAPNVYPFPRPLELPPELPPPPPRSPPIIGTFGLPTPGKGFDKLVAAVNREFDRAVLRMNIPMADYVPAVYRSDVDATIASLHRAVKPGIELRVTREFMEKPDLIRWCAENTLNAFLYDRAMTGLAATTDQAVSSGRPLAVSANETFRHIHTYLTPYPFRSLSESIERSAPEVAAMAEAWSPKSFARTFEEMLDDLALPAPGPGNGQRAQGQTKLRRRLPLPRSLSRVELGDFLPPVVSLVVEEVRRQLRRGEPATTALPSYASPLFASFSAGGEDVWLETVLRWQPAGFYVGVGGGDHTYRFYRWGWSGINVELSPRALQARTRQRPRDVNLLAGPGALDLSAVFAQHVGEREVDFLAVDAPAACLEILDSLDWERHRPTFALVSMSARRDGVVQALQRRDYGLLMNNHHNGLFVDVASDRETVRHLLDRDQAACATS